MAYLILKGTVESEKYIVWSLVVDMYVAYGTYEELCKKSSIDFTEARKDRVDGSGTSNYEGEYGWNDPEPLMVYGVGIRNYMESSTFIPRNKVEDWVAAMLADSNGVHGEERLLEKYGTQEFFEVVD